MSELTAKSEGGYFSELKATKWYLKWFLLLILLRPLIDSMYGMKDVSMFASPLYWVGVLTPVLVVVSLLSRGKRFTGSRYFTPWAALILFNSILIMLVAPRAIVGLEVVLKITTIVFIYYYVRSISIYANEFILIVKSFAYSSIFVYATMIYEIFGGGFGEQRFTSGVEQMVGPFADAVSYGMYLNVSLIAWLYLYNKSIVKSKFIIFFVVPFTAIGIGSIAHVASLILLASIAVLFIIMTTEKEKIKVYIGAGLIVLFGYAISADLLEARYQPKIEREMQVARGERHGAQAFHGRMSRWTMLMPQWYNMSILSKTFGVSFEMERLRNAAGWVLISPHNDYLRIMFMSGAFGLILYFMWLLRIYILSRRLEGGSRFVVVASIITVILYSITTLPTLYPVIIYFVASAFAWAERSKELQEETVTPVHAELKNG